MDHSHKQGMPAEQCATIILNAIKNNKEEILIGGGETKAVWLKRYFLSGLECSLENKQKNKNILKLSIINYTEMDSDVIKITIAVGVLLYYLIKNRGSQH